MRHIRNAHLWRALIIVGLFCTWVHIMLSGNSGSMDRAGVYEDIDVSNNVSKSIETTLKSVDYDSYDLMNINETSEQALALVSDELHKYLAVHPGNTTDDLMNTNETSKQALALVPDELNKCLAVHPGNTTERIGTNNISEIKRAIERYNEAQIIYNEDIYGPVQNDTIIIAIQVHIRLRNLRHLIESLAQATNIGKILLIFSHDHYDEEINNVVRSINFTMVMQIFYPYSIQIHPYEFPGVDPNDCPRDATFECAVRLKCNNALHPDSYGHYREANYTQIKHHWWWKANRIFNQLQATSNHTGIVVFLEEDHYVAEDFIHMLHMLRNTADKNCSMCEILCLGTYYRYGNIGNSDELKINRWDSTLHNMGFAFNRTVWNEILELKEKFCTYDDYNWDYSLFHLSKNRPRGEFNVILCQMPRVFHIGECGMHTKNEFKYISIVQNLLQNAKKYMYPSKVKLATKTRTRTRTYINYGGWGDKRDQELCVNMTLIGRQMKKYVMIT